jgi:hypothetical protein
VAQIEYGGKKHSLGNYHTKEEAIAARKKGEQSFFLQS